MSRRLPRLAAAASAHSAPPMSRSAPTRNPGKEANHTYLDLALLLARRIEVAVPNALRDPAPEPPALPVVLVLDLLHRHLFLGASDVRERRARSHVLARLVPRALERVLRRERSWRRQSRLERVRLAREVSLALVLDLCGRGNECMRQRDKSEVSRTVESHPVEL